MNPSSQPAAVHLVLQRRAAGAPEVDVVLTDPAGGRDWRPGRGLRAYGSAEGAACFEAVMADFMPPAAPPRTSGRTPS
ncbi:hypothetical protein [Aquincola tertiaricarbonis]|uniref:hypothetical protein n=1 Tax=Aquincola tertiaricarbonis TaxID=391953 RepID=UPI0012ED9400|nr:hypothetical protein [Aquincola tertiaricarbonis]